MINGTSAIKGASLSLCFSVGAVLFSSHAGGGFATGNQENVYFISLGWLGPITAIVTMLLFTLTIKEAMNMYNSRHLTSYKHLFQNLYRPVPGIEFLFEGFFYIMVLMAVSATISGAASALAAQTGLNYYTGIGVVGAIIFILTIFGADLVRRATTYMGIAILAMAITISPWASPWAVRWKAPGSSWMPWPRTLRSTGSANCPRPFSTPSPIPASSAWSSPP